MSSLLLQKLGVYIDPEFLSKGECEHIRQAIRQSEHVDAHVFSASTRSREVDTQKRQSLFANVPDSVAADITRRIEKLRSPLEEKFGERFDDQMEAAKFLLYRQGHFFAPHNDDQLGRLVNVTIYLNDQSDDGADGSYSGGELKIYGLIDRPQWENRGIGLRGECGMLVAYRANLTHEITPILQGERHAIVARFLKRKGGS